MAPIMQLGIKPEDVGGRGERPTIVREVYDTLRQPELAVYCVLPDDFEPMDAFFARNPDRALRWICTKTSRVKLIRSIDSIYKSLEMPNLEGTTETDDASPEHVTDGGVVSPPDRGTKRKRAPKEKTTRATNKALVKKLNLGLVQTVANSQDWEDAKAPEGLSNEERKYRAFAARMPGVGINAVTQMITKAVAVGTMDVIRDWQSILAVWKRQNHYRKKLFQPVAAPLSQAGSQGAQIVQDGPHERGRRIIVVSQQQAEVQQRDEAGLTASEMEMFRYKYFDAQKTHIDGLADDMRHRWKMDELYEEYERLEKEIRTRGKGTGARGVGYADRAKEHLFGSTYVLDLGRRPTRSENPELWTTFGNYLDWGKRWNMLKRRFGGVGIFGLLPRSLIPNAFVETTLTQTRLAQWADMVAECNSDVSAMSAQIQPLFLACMEESAPPPEFLFLEDVDSSTRITRPLMLFMGDNNYSGDAPENSDTATNTIESTGTMANGRILEVLDSEDDEGEGV